MKTFKAALILLIFSFAPHMKAQQSRASDQAELETKIICLIISDEV
jgi:hypothetical protein